MNTSSPCRCGHAGDDTAHPCHSDGYTCRKPDQRRFYNPHPAKPASLAGMQMKFSAVDTWACDAHWDAFKAKLASQVTVARS